MLQMRRMPVVTTLVAVIVGIIAAADWILDPDRAVFWLLAIATMAGILLIATVAEGGSADDEPRKLNLANSAAIAGILLGVALLMPLVEAAGPKTQEVQLRWWGAMSGIVLVFIANRIPKRWRRPESTRSPAAFLAAKRFNGWLFVIAGFTYMMLWIAAPIALAQTLSIGVVAVAFALVLVRYLMGLRQTTNG